MRLDIAAPQRLQAPLRWLLEGFEAIAPVAEPLAVSVDLTFAPGPLATDTSRGLRFIAAQDGAYLDECPGWSARLEGFEPGLRPRMTALIEPRARAEQATRALVTILLRVAAATAVVLRDALLVHGCAMAAPDGRRAVLFVGPSGAGKSTMTRRLPGWRPLSDDTVLVQRSAIGLTVAGTPFPGSEGLPRSGRAVPLERVIVLSPGAPRLALAPLDAGAAYGQLIQRAMWYVEGGPLTAQVMDLVGSLAALPVHRLESGLADRVQPLFQGSVA